MCYEESRKKRVLEPLFHLFFTQISLFIFYFYDLFYLCGRGKSQMHSSLINCLRISTLCLHAEVWPVKFNGFVYKQKLAKLLGIVERENNDCLVMMHTLSTHQAFCVVY